MQNQDEIQLKDILITISEYKSFLFKKKLPIIIISILFIFIGILYSYITDVDYNAEITFVVESDKGGGMSPGSISGIASQFGFDIGARESSTFSQSNLLEILKSRVVIVSSLMQNAKVSGEQDLLIEHYLNINEFKQHASEQVQAISFYDNTTQLHDSISYVVWQEIVKDKLEIDLQSDEANIIKLSYTSSNQDFAKEFVLQLITQMREMYVKHQTAQANNTLEFLKDRADSVFVELEIAEQEYARITDINQRIIKASGRLKELQLMRKVEVLNAMYLEIVKNLELSKITLLNTTPIINIIDEPILPLEEKKVSNILAALVGGVLGFFLSLSYFIFRKLIADSLADNNGSLPV